MAIDDRIDPLATVAQSHRLSPADAFAAARAAHALAPFPAWPLRAARLRALETLIRDNREAIAAAISADFGQRPAEETELLEIFPSISGIRHALKHGRRWMRPRRRWAGLMFLPARTELIPQPVGVVGVIVPWNYPLYLAIGPLADALTAGNRVLVKMSEYTPRFSALFAQLIARYFPDREVTVDRRRCRRRARIRRIAVRPPAVHRFDRSRARGDALRGREPDSGHARTRRQVAGDHRTGRAFRTCGGTHPGRQDAQRRADLHCAGLRIASARTCRRLHRQRTRDRRAAVSATGIERAVREHRVGPPLRAPGRVARCRGCSGRDSRTRWPMRRPIRRHVRSRQCCSRTSTIRMRVMQEEIFGPLLPLVPYDTLDDALAYVAARSASARVVRVRRQQRDDRRDPRAHACRRRQRQRHDPAHRAA